MNDYRFIKFDRDKDRAILILNRPSKNIMNVEMLEEVVDALGQAREDESKNALLKEWV